MDLISKYNFLFRVSILIGLIVSFSSCEKEELPVKPAEVQSQVAGIGENYENHVYFNIIDNEFIKVVEHFGYDLSVDASEAGKTIYLNSSNYMFARNMGVVSFESVSDTNGTDDWAYDYPTGEPGRTAIGKWFNSDGSSKNQVFVIDRGFDVVGNSFGYLKIQIISCDNSEYKIRVAELDGSNDRLVTIPKNPDKLHVQFSFDDDQVKDVEPDKDEWHLLFTQYTDYDLTTDGDTIPYSVRGVLINTYNTSAVKVEDPSFEKIDFSLIPTLSFSNEINVIGYDWKFFSLDTGYYTVYPGISYVIKEESGTYFKLRFLEFYDNDGRKGFPSFEVISL